MPQYYDECSYCGGRVTEQKVMKACWWGAKLLALVDSVPAGVCEQCGERYYRAEVLKNIEKLLNERAAFHMVEVPLAEYPAS